MNTTGRSSPQEITAQGFVVLLITELSKILDYLQKWDLQNKMFILKLLFCYTKLNIKKIIFLNTFKKLPINV